MCGLRFYNQNIQLVKEHYIDYSGKVTFLYLIANVQDVMN